MEPAGEGLEKILVVRLVLVTIPGPVVMPVGVFVAVEYSQVTLVHFAPIGNLGEVILLLPQQFLRFPN